MNNFVFDVIIFIYVKEGMLVFKKIAKEFAENTLKAADVFSFSLLND